MITIDLPLAPSANRLTENIPRDGRKHGGGRRNTADYRAWTVEAGKDILAQRPKWGSVRTIHGNYILVVSVPFDARIDLGNVIKATEDLLTKMQVIEDDRLATYIVLRRSGELAGGDRMKVSVSAEDGALQ